MQNLTSYSSYRAKKSLLDDSVIKFIIFVFITIIHYNIHNFMMKKREKKGAGGRACRYLGDMSFVHLLALATHTGAKSARY